MRKPTVYLAHNYAAREWLRRVVVPFFVAEGVDVTSAWVIGEVQKHDSSEAKASMLDIDRSGSVLFFASNYGETPGRGKYIEVGYALHAGKQVIVVDCPDPKDGDCVFFHLPGVVRVSTYKEALELIRERAKNRIIGGGMFNCDLER